MMNYYAQGGEALGLKSLAQQLPNYGRYNDDMVAHISSDEARLLKSMGGAGTINPVTGLPEYGIGKSFKKVWKGTVGKVEDAVKPITKPITDAVKPILPYVQYIAPFIPGVGTAMAVGLGALGSGFAGGGGFNVKRGIMGGITAYGMSNLAQGLSAAGGATGSTAATAPIELGVPGTDVVASTTAQTGLQTPGVFDQVMAGDLSGAASTAGQSVGEGISSAYNTVTDPNTYTQMGDKFATQMSDTGQGIKNLTGIGETTMSSGDALKAAGKEFGMGSASAIYGGATGQLALDEADKMKNEADLANAKSQEEYDSIMARIEGSRLRGVEAVKANPYMFAMGGSVDDEAGVDDLNTNNGNMQNGMFTGNVPSLAARIAGMAKGGMAKGGTAPRFLSGGGDGMSDDIKATINGTQPARLADGEFVIPADVVSHLGNGSSKAGAKQLYSMMDKVRSARTGNKKQGKQINPAKFMPA